MVQSIQLGFSRSLGRVTSNEANKSAMLRAEWTTTARRAPSGAPFRPNEISIFCLRTLQAERHFFRYKQSKQVISRQYIDKPVIYLLVFS